MRDYIYGLDFAPKSAHRALETPHMADPKAFDAETFEALLAPISDNLPAGPDLRNDEKLAGEFRGVRDARDLASKTEKDLWTFSHLGSENADKPEKPKPPDWKDVLDKAVGVLSKRSKDLWVAAWMIEALARQKGFQGLHDGFRMTRELCERYWDGLHPQPDPDDEELHDDEVLNRLVKLDLLDDAKPSVNLITQIEQIPITEAQVNGRALTSADYKEALQLEESSDAESNRLRLDAGAISLKEFQNAVEESSLDFYRGLLTDLEDCGKEFDLLHEAIRERCGSTRPPAADNIRSALESCLARVRELAGPLLNPGGEFSADSAGEGGTGTGKPGGPGMAVGSIASREDAFKALLKVADFFRRTEPHSPVSYALEQAVRWGKMSLPDLLEDLVPNREVLEQLFQRTGIKPKESSESSDND